MKCPENKGFKVDDDKERKSLVDKEMCPLSPYIERAAVRTVSILSGQRFRRLEDKIIMVKKLLSGQQKEYVIWQKY